jgi:hypothetical protein
VEGRSSSQKVVMMMIRVTINGMVIQVILMVIRGKQRRSYCRGRRCGIR